MEIGRSEEDQKRMHEIFDAIKEEPSLDWELQELTLT